MNLALIIPGSICYSPYVRIYSKIFDEEGIDYSIISWNREGDDKVEGVQYNVASANGHGSASWREYRGYISFVKKQLIDNSFDRLIIFGPQLACLLGFFLLSNYRGRYMLDYRDLSIEQKPVFRLMYSILLKNSACNVISSPGFKKYLPKSNYILSHNINIDLAKSAIDDKIDTSYEMTDIEVLTIGAIRDFESNVEILNSLGNQEGILLHFVGKGGAVNDLQRVCNEKSYSNVIFDGYYEKKDEPRYVSNATFLNIYYPRRPSHDTALSNRFYNSLIFQKPMIVTANTTQGDYVAQYGLGLSISNCDDLIVHMKDYLSSQQYLSFKDNSRKLLLEIIDDYNKFVEALNRFVCYKA